MPALEDIGAWPDGIEQVFTVADAAIPEPEEETTADDALESSLTGLHAKCYIVDDGNAARVLTGSAKQLPLASTATSSSFVELIGTRQSAGIDALLASEQGPTRLVDILQPVRQPLNKVCDEEQENVRKRLDDACTALSTARLELVCSVSPERADAYDVTLRRISAIEELSSGVTVTCWPVTLAPERARTFDADTEAAAIFETLSTLALSRFLSFRSRPAQASTRQNRVFALKVPLVGGPENREDLVLRAMLSDQATWSVPSAAAGSRSSAVKRAAEIGAGTRVGWHSPVVIIRSGAVGVLPSGARPRSETTGFVQRLVAISARRRRAVNCCLPSSTRCGHPSGKCVKGGRCARASSTAGHRPGSSAGAAIPAGHVDYLFDRISLSTRFGASSWPTRSDLARPSWRAGSLPRWWTALGSDVKRIDVVYICSNSSIASRTSAA